MKESQKTNEKHVAHNGSTRSYILGFIISIICTIIPYMLVRWQVSTGTMLLLIILGIAFVQLFVQLVFFLHLGRGPKPLYNVIFFAATAGMIVLVVGASLIIMDNLYRNMSPEEMTTRLAQDENIALVNGKETGACQGNEANHMVMVSATSVSPGMVEAHRCDTLTLINDSSDVRKFIFSQKSDTVSYGGVDSVTVRGGHSETITLNEIGDFTFRDTSDPGITGTMIIRQKNKCCS